VWTPRDLPEGVLEGEGIYVPRGGIFDYVTMAGHVKLIEVKPLAEGKEKLGNVEAVWREFIGYIDESHWDEEPTRYGFAVYRRYTTPWTSFSVKIRDLNDDEKVELFENVDDFTKVFLIRHIPREKAVELVLRSRLCEKYDILTDDERVRKAYIDYRKRMMNEAFMKGDLEKAAYYAKILKSKGYEDNEIQKIIEHYEKYAEEKRRKWEEEKRKREEAHLRKLMEEKEKLIQEFNGLPIAIDVKDVSIEVKLARYVDKNTFNEFMTRCKKLGLRFDAKKKVWIRFVV